MTGAATLPADADADVVVVGAGHNGLVAALLLARAGLDVLVLEERDVIGGATRTETPFAAVPGLAHSTGSYLLGVMPPEVLAATGVDLPVLRRDPHYVLATPGGPEGPSLTLGADRAANRAALARVFGEADLAADEAMAAELAALREDLAPAWLAEPLDVAGTAERYIRPGLRRVFTDLVTGSVLDYLDRFGFRSELLMAMYAVTDGLSGLHAGPDTPGTGHNFLVHNMCRLPGAGGTWMIVRGGMGAVSAAFAEAATRAGARILAGTAVSALTFTGPTLSGVALADGRQVRAPVVLGACDPFRLAGLIAATDPARVPAELSARLERIARPGATMKVNLALRDLPQLSCLPAGSPSPWGSTVHLVPDALGHPLEAVRAMWRDVQDGRLPAEPTIEWYLHTTVDPSLQDPDGHHSSALFVQSVPYAPVEGTWPELIGGYTESLLALCDRYAPGTSDLVADAVPMAPPDIEAHFGMTGGHIHHVDNTIAFADRMPYATGVEGVYAGSAGTHPAGSVIGAAGHNAARRILADLGRVDKAR